MRGFRSTLAGGIAISVIFCAAGVGAGYLDAHKTVPVPAVVQSASFRNLTVSVPASAPLGNNGRNGSVVFTFDDGPDSYTQALLDELEKLHLKAVFFVFGWKAEAHPALIREELADGDLVENHTWDHLSFTGASTDTRPLTGAKIRSELMTAQQALVSLGVPAPALYRPPFGDITPADNAIAAQLGLRIVQPFSVIRNGGITDSRDWTGISAAQIVKDVTEGYWAKGRFYSGLRTHGTSIIGFHDSAPGSCLQDPPLCGDVIQTIQALPGIVAWMNAHDLSVTINVPANATGGTVPNITVK